MTCDSAPRLSHSMSCRAYADRLRGKRIVQCHGAFDLVHIGHLIHFEEARALGDVRGDDRRTMHHQEAVGDLQRDHRAHRLRRWRSSITRIVQGADRIVGRRGIASDVYVKGPSTRPDAGQESSIYHEMRARELRGPHPFHVGRDVFLDEAVIFCARSRSGEPAAGTNAWCFAICRRWASSWSR